MIPKALARAGLSTADVDLYEINEALASVAVAAVRLLDLDPDRVNVASMWPGGGMGSAMVVEVPR
ncbi:hypothetical protein [Streptomyces sp. NPDC005485]|uniref:hypothetical protein n=1 Tax=Streptomyces sp. NPDC005485 TaxID=3155591 RepID=UPI0033A8F856